MKTILLSATLGVAMLSLTACACPEGRGGHDHGDRSAMKGCPMCAKGMAGESVWCEHCKMGFVGGEKVACHGCYAAKTGGGSCPMCMKKN